MSKKIEKSDEQWRAELTPEQYEICRNKGTERPFSGSLYACKDAGLYHCACCGQPLFSSEAKYDSGSGWPSFYQPLNEQALEEHFDDSHGMRRTEIVCSRCNAHLGHVFSDGPAPTGLRYCVNSVSLRFDKKS